MKLTLTALAGVHVIDLEPREDERGFLARSFSRDELRAHGLMADLVQSLVSWNRRRGTLRGMHYQVEPHAETKLVRCTAGGIFDVALDLREGSPTRHHWISVELSAENRRALYIPAGCAHGFQALTDGAEVLYNITETYRPERERIARWDDPAFAITWPVAPAIVAERDRAAALVAGGGASA